MRHLYVTANLKLFDEEALAKSGFNSHGDRHNHIIENWNQVIKKEDAVVITGGISDSFETHKIKEVLNKLNGDKYLLYSVQDGNYTKEKWQSLGISACFSLPLSHHDEEERHIVLTTECLHNPSKDEVLNLMQDQTYYGAELCKENNSSIDLFCQGSTRFFKDRFQDKILNVDLDKWDYAPLLCQNLWNIYCQMKVFNELST